VIQGGINIMSVNFFSWIREGVRQSVLLGVSDAIEQLGTPAPTEELHPSVVGFLQGRPEKSSHSNARIANIETSATDTNGPAAQRGPRKRLGKSLKDITPTTSTARTAPSQAHPNIAPGNS
jgi:hypothetical protein